MVWKGRGGGEGEDNIVSMSRAAAATTYMCI